MICRIWRGWTTRENADAYQGIVLGQVIPGIEAMRIPGFRKMDLLKMEHGDEIEFTTLMWFDSLDSVRAFMGEDYSVSHVPSEARAVLKHFDARAVHHSLLAHRVQPSDS